MYFSYCYIYLMKISYYINIQKIWSNIYPEIILMDYLFNPINNIKEDKATLIITLLIDLQEDYRFYVKQNFLKYILK